MHRAGLIIIVLVAGCTLDFDGVGPHGSVGGGGGASGQGGQTTVSAAGGGGQSASGGMGGMGGAGGMGGGTGGTLVVSCDDGGGKCMDIPVGFDGAVHLLEGQSCSDESLVFEGGSSFLANSAECECACIAQSGFCTLPATAHAFENLGCNSMAVDFPVTTSCIDVPTVSNTPARGVSIGPVSPPGCISDDAAWTSPAVDFTPDLAGCDFESVGCEPDQACLPSDGGTFCFYGPMDAGACPADFEQKLLVRETDLSDNRQCTCSCGAPSPALCAVPSWSLYDTEDCDVSGTLDVVGTPSCNTGAGGEAIRSARVSAAANITCDVVNEVQTGGVSAVNWLTLCCR